MAGNSRRTMNVGFQANPDVWQAFKQLLAETGVTANQGIERLVLRALDEKGIPGVERLPSRFTAKTLTYSGEATGKPSSRRGKASPKAPASPVESSAK